MSSPAAPVRRAVSGPVHGENRAPSTNEPTAAQPDSFRTGKAAVTTVRAAAEPRGPGPVQASASRGAGERDSPYRVRRISVRQSESVQNEVLGQPGPSFGQPRNMETVQRANDTHRDFATVKPSPSPADASARNGVPTALVAAERGGRQRVEPAESGVAPGRSREIMPELQPRRPVVPPVAAAASPPAGPKLTIGKLTVEVVPPASVVKQTVIVRESSHEPGSGPQTRESFSKLRFGIGQL